MIPQYRITVPNGMHFNGKTYGVVFSNGSAYLDDQTVPTHLGRSVDEVARLFLQEYKYDVQPLTDDAKEQVQAWKEALKGNAPARTGTVIKVPKPKKNVIVRNEGEYKVEE